MTSRLVLAIAAGALLAPAPAHAGGLAYIEQINTLTYLDEPEFDGDLAHDLEIDRVGDGYRLTDVGTGIFLYPSAPCEQRNSWEVRCPAEGITRLTFFLGEASDTLTVATDLDVAGCGGGGADVLTGGAGNDILDGGPGPDDVRGGAGDDGLIKLHALFDTFPACRLSEPSPQGDRYDGGPGPDRIEGNEGRDIISGGDGVDLIFGYGGADRLVGDGGVDLLVGMDGDDEFDGGAGDDRVYGGVGNDRIDGGPGDDFLGWTVRFDATPVDEPPVVVTAAEEGDDRLYGGEGDDTLVAGPGPTVQDVQDASSLGGRAVDRSLAAAPPNGADRYAGGPGHDEVTYVNRDSPVHVSLDGLANDGSAGEGDRVDPDVETVTGGARADVLVAAASGSSLQGDLGNDVLTGGPGADALSGGDDEDRLSGAGGDDDLGGAGGADELDGGDGRDLLFGGAGDDAAFGGRGADGLEGGPGADVLEGGDGPDCLSGFSGVADPLPGSTCRAYPFPATPAGADGNDVLRGGAGRDRIDGGPGEDVADYARLRGPVVVALAGAPASAAFGRSADADDLAADVEAVRGGRGGDTLIGNGADNLLDGGPGHDQLIGAGGIDRLRGGSGSDLLDARDGAADAVRCGTQRDLALIDDEDEVISGLADACEIPDAGNGVAGLPRIAAAGSCALPIRLPGVNRRFMLGQSASVFWGSRVDALRCAVRVRGTRGRAALLSGAAVKLGRRGSDLIARLAGGRPAACGRRIAATRRLAVHKAPAGFLMRGRTLWARGAGASWQMIDGCRRTRVRETHGRVKVSRDGREWRRE
jgi:Ca2+-binding RTX toxin-like protein